MVLPIARTGRAMGLEGIGGFDGGFGRGHRGDGVAEDGRGTFEGYGVGDQDGVAGGREGASERRASRELG